MFIPSTFKRPVSSWKALNLRKTLLMASSVRLKPLNCRSEERFSRNAETDLVCRLLLEKKKSLDGLLLTIDLLERGPRPELADVQVRSAAVFAGPSGRHPS